MVAIARAVILPVVCCGCETWSHVEGRKQVEGVRGWGAEGDTGPKLAEVTEKWRKLRSEELKNVCPSPSINRVTD